MISDEIVFNKLRKGIKLDDKDLLYLREIVSLIHNTLQENCDVKKEHDCEEYRFSIVDSGNKFIRCLNKHTGELKTIERKVLLELIETAAKVMKFY